MLSKLQTTLFYLTLLSKFALYVQISGLAIHCLVHATLSPPLSVVQKKSLIIKLTQLQVTTYILMLLTKLYFGLFQVCWELITRLLLILLAHCCKERSEYLKCFGLVLSHFCVYCIHVISGFEIWNVTSKKSEENIYHINKKHLFNNTRFSWWGRIEKQIPS